MPERRSVEFTDRAAALQAAQDACPTDVLIAPRGDAKRPSNYAVSPGDLSAMLDAAEFDPTRGDKVFLWLQ